MATKQPQATLPRHMMFSTAGFSGILAWCVVHPFSTAAVQMNLANASGATKAKSFVPFVKDIIETRGVMSLYNGLQAGIVRQLFYATSRFGLFEVFRDELAKHREVDIYSRLAAGVTSGAMAALISCPAEVSLVRMSNDATLPVDQRRNYKGVVDAFSRIFKEEGVPAFFRGSAPFVNRAMIVGCVQVGTYDQFKSTFRNYGITSPFPNVLAASFSAGLLYSILTMPFETAKNRMAFQKPLADGTYQYRSTMQSIGSIAAKEGTLSLWSGFLPYYLRCGGHTVSMFVIVEALRGFIVDNYYTHE